MATKLDALLSRLHKAEAEVKEAEASLAEKKAAWEDIARKEIPDYFAKVGITRITLENGKVLEVKPHVHVNLPVKDFSARTLAIQWIRDNGGEDLVKRKLVVEEPDEWLLKQAQGYTYGVKDEIHPSTLRAFVKDYLGMNATGRVSGTKEDIPMNVYVYNEVEEK